MTSCPMDARALLALTLLASASVAGAQPLPAVRVSVSSEGLQGNGPSLLLNISRTGRFVLFRSLATNLVVGDTNGVEDLFVRDRDTDADGILDEPGAASTVRVSVGTSGEQADLVCPDGRLSPDGRFVLFRTEASTLVAGDTNFLSDVFVRDRDTDADGVFDEPGAVSTTRVSEGNGGVQANAESIPLTMTPDARYAFFSSPASSLSPIPVNGVHQIYRKDRITGALRLVTSSLNGGPGAATPAVAPYGQVSTSDDGQVVVFAAVSSIFQPGAFGSSVFVRDLAANTLDALPLPASSPVSSGSIHEALLATAPAPSPGITPDGSTVFYSIEIYAALGSFFGHSGTVHSFDRLTGAERRLSSGFAPRFAGDSRYIVFPGSFGSAPLFSQCPAVYTGLYLFDRFAGATSQVTSRQMTNFSTSGSSSRTLFATFAATDCVEGLFPPAAPTVNLADALFGHTPVVMPSPVRPGLMDHEGRHVVFESEDAGIIAPGQDTNTAFDVFAVDLASRLDQDSDGLDDRWEAATGLNYTSAAGVDGPAGDPDGDGVTNLEERQAGSHPRGTAVRYLAEGAENAFFKTRIALANPTETPATAVVRFLADGGGTRTVYVPVPARARRTADVSTVEGLPSQAFSIVTESDAPLVVERTMSWDASGYGAHAERALSDASTTWFLAEGATTGEFSLFYLLQNPGPTTATATVRYLRPAGMAPIERTYTLPPRSRTTIPVNSQAPELASTDVSAAITADQPIFVERSMYPTRGGQSFTAGHASAGVTAAAASWFLAEGATGPFFDLFVLIANPGSSYATVEARYLLADGEALTKTYTVAANSRRTIYVDTEEFPGRGQALANVAVSTTLTSTTAVPIVVERAMWFPGPELTANFWAEAHNSPGSTVTAPRWVLADGEEAGPAHTRTFLLVANTSAFAGRVRVTVLLERGSALTGSTYDVPANSRTTIPVGLDFFLDDQRFGILVESVDTPTPAQLVVERAMYWDAGGVVWAAGTNVLGTPVP